MAQHDHVILDGGTGLVVTLASHGARIASVKWHGTEIVAGGIPDYAGAVCGRYANRIGGARFTLDGIVHELSANEPNATLHGGKEGFDKRDWVPAKIEQGVRYTLLSPDGDQGFPGGMVATATYTLDGGLLALELTAETTLPTVVNLTNHVYWNLAGGGDARKHHLQVSADRYTPATAALIPLGPPRDVAGTEFDFRTEREIAGVYDINFCLNGKRGELHHAATLSDPGTRRSVELWTTEPGVQFYTSQHFAPPLTKYGAIALEPQTWPDAPNRPDFPSAILRPGELYRHRIEWRFLQG
ncbi:MAG: galactose mutarotase [Rhizobiales bacterium]|nr:galactose mutarotase [Hyphomicrobiales bacterium]